MMNVEVVDLVRNSKFVVLLFVIYFSYVSTITLPTGKVGIIDFIEPACLST